MRVDYKDLLVRAAKTFVQSFLAVFAVGMTTDVLGNTNALIALTKSAVVAGLAGLISLAGNWVNATK